ncbi:Anthranilate 1,2-dioxygenase electron transfer component [Sulfitobacter sp. THAF37]|uniref:FAD-binding oxidoreductase n=1 Tax=Sulfitobacter sp. THAF37 TaxID=2587855 RepID=UPI001268A9EB|nr:FAD-binding oxidoreductase [Sulfitobacter sp. THAF37]QFT58006.1 Anthranilate 1,2-dioxygenase electron transfer component [Sulfitobacter sp. THAF37]
MADRIILKDLKPVTHDTHHYVFSRPEGLSFKPGQAAELAIDRDGWREEGRPFTFVSQPEDADIEFVIKSYPDHDGVTEQLAQLKPGAELTLDGPFGAITDHGPGTFIAAGAGITPFIPILRKHDREGTMDGCALFFANKTEADIIMRGEWEAMKGLRAEFVLSDEKVDGMHHGKIDKSLLKERVTDFDQTFYLCGPQEFVDDVRDALKDLGAKESSIITEEGW